MIALRAALLVGICACTATADLLPRDDVVNGIDWTTLSKSSAKSAFTYTLNNATQPGTNDLVYATAAGYRFGLPWWTSIPAAILNLLIALRLFVVDGWRWKGRSSQVEYKNKQTQPYWQDSEARQREQEQTEVEGQTEAPLESAAANPHSIREWYEMRRGARPAARPEASSSPTRTASPTAHGVHAGSIDGDNADDKDETPPYIKITAIVFRYLQLAYLFIQVIAGLAYIAIGSNNGPAGISVGALRYAGPATYSLLLAVVCQVWSSVFLFFSPHVGRIVARLRMMRSYPSKPKDDSNSNDTGSINAENEAIKAASDAEKKQRRLLILSLTHHAVLLLGSIVTAILAILVFFMLTAPPASKGPIWQVWSPWCVPYGYIGENAGGKGAGGGFTAGELVYTLPNKTGTDAFPSGLHRWPCADIEGLALYEEDVPFFPRLALDAVFGSFACVFLVLCVPRLAQLKAWQHRTHPSPPSPARSRYWRYAIDGVVLISVFITCLFAAFKFYSLSQLERSQMYFGGSFLVCPGLDNATTVPFDVSGVGMCFGVEVQLPARSASGLSSILAMDKANIAQLIFNV